MLKIFVLLPCSNDWLPALSFNLGKDLRIAKNKDKFKSLRRKIEIELLI